MEDIQRNWQSRLTFITERIKKTLQNPELSFLDTATKANFSERIERVSYRIADPCLRIAVVGEFSTGKSSFINALVREELCEVTNSIATSAATFISKGVNDIVVYFNSGLAPLRYSETVSVVKIDDDFKKFLSRYQTCLSDQSVDVRRIEVTLEREILDNESVIVDTPGFNSGDHQHQNILEDVLRNEADAAVITFSAINPGRETDLDYIYKFKDQIRKMFFVLTKADRPPTKNRLLEAVHHLQKKLKAQFGMDHLPPVYALTSKFDFKDSDSEKYHIFRSFERKLLDFAQIEKLFFIFNPINKILDVLISEISDHVAKQEAQLACDKKEIEKIRLESIDQFMARNQKKATNWLEQAFLEVENTLKIRIDDIFLNTQNIIQKILDCDNFLDSEALEAKIKKEIGSLEKEIRSVMSEEYVELYEKATVVAMARLQKRFHKYYKNLKKLSIDIPIKNFVESNAPEKALLQTLANKLSKRLILEWKTYNSGFFNGVRNILFPGRAKQLIAKSIMDDLQKQFDLQKADIQKNLKFRTKKFKKNSKNNIVKPFVKKYVNEYKNIINAIICTNDQKCEELKKKHCSIFGIKKNLESTKKELEVEKEGIDTLQRLILSITDGSFRIGERGWDDIDTLKLLTNRYDYKKGLEHIFETIDPLLHHHNYSYLWGCLSRLFNRDPRGHYLRFINDLNLNGDKKLLPCTIDHLEQNDFAGLESIHSDLDYARSDSLLAAKLYDVFLKHDRGEISREIHGNHCLKLLGELDSHTKRLLEQCNRMPL